MSNNTELHTKAVQAATRFCERRGYEILATGWEPEDDACFAHGSSIASRLDPIDSYRNKWVNYPRIF